MTWDDYKELCERPDHFSRFALELTIGAGVDDPIRHMLLDAMGTPPLEKPVDHRGGAETDYFRVDLEAELVPQVLKALEYDAGRVDERGARHLRHLAVVWREYGAFQESAS